MKKVHVIKQQYFCDSFNKKSRVLKERESVFERSIRVIGNNDNERREDHKTRIELADSGFPCTMSDINWYSLN
jgi:hypothetical protein